MKIFEAKQSLEECIAAQDFSRASDLKDSVTELENLKNQLLKQAEEPELKEVRVEKVGRSLVHSLVLSFVRPWRAVGCGWLLFSP